MGILDNKIKLNAKAETRTLKCGCIQQAENLTVEEHTKYNHSLKVIKRWFLVKYCESHIPNYDKKADKMQRREKKMINRAKIQDMELQKRVAYRKKRRKISRGRLS